MYAQPTAPGTKRDAPALPMPLPSTVALAALTGLVFLLGILPGFVLEHNRSCDTQPRLIRGKSA